MREKINFSFLPLPRGGIPYTVDLLGGTHVSNIHFHRFLDHNKKLSTLSSISAILAWDQEVMLPSGSSEMRASQSSYLQAHAHSLMTDPKYLETLQALNAEADTLSQREQRAVKVHLTRTLRAHKIPSSLVEEIARAGVFGQEAWKDARKKNDFSLFSPQLQKLLELQKQYGACVKESSQTPYEAILSDYEPEYPLEEMRQLFQTLQKELVPAAAAIVEKVNSQNQSQEKFQLQMPLTDQRRLSQEITRAVGFDLECGRIDEAAHPFCSGAWKDVRLTTRYRESDWTDSLYSILHEAGHGLYEQGMGKLLGEDPLAHAASVGMHESQSRFWENCIGRSREFAHFMVAFMKKNFAVDPQLTPESYYRHVNKPSYSYIRVDADEVTYNLHILLRYELEDALFRGDLKVNDLPAAWNERVNHYLHLPTPKDSEGVLQDVHWAWGSFGYFPSYTIGNIIAADLLEVMKTELPVFSLVERGDFLPIKTWLATRVHARGEEMSTRNLVKSITGRGIESKNFIQYLNSKFANY